MARVITCPDRHTAPPVAHEDVAREAYGQAQYARQVTIRHTGSSVCYRPPTTDHCSSGFYEEGYFAYDTPAYMYVLWLVAEVKQLFFHDHEAQIDQEIAEQTNLAATMPNHPPTLLPTRDSGH